jgi:riboflavin synthase alpha subunit
MNNYEMYRQLKEILNSTKKAEKHFTKVLNDLKEKVRYLIENNKSFEIFDIVDKIKNSNEIYIKTSEGENCVEKVDKIELEFDNNRILLHFISGHIKFIDEIIDIEKTYRTLYEYYSIIMKHHTIYIFEE